MEALTLPTISNYRQARMLVMWLSPIDKKGDTLNLDVMLAKRKMKSNELAKRIGITEQNLSILKIGKAKAVRLSTLDAICEHLECQPDDSLEYKN